jgi:hypothetical protein
LGVHLFVRKREKYPRAVLRHRVEFWDAPNGERLVRVNLLIENTSDVLLRIREGFTWVQQMRPWPEEAVERYKAQLEGGDHKEPEVAWPLISEKKHESERELEPKEPDEISMDFIIDQAYEKILIYSHLKNSHKRGELGWIVSTVVDFEKGGAVLQEGQGQAIKKPRPKAAKAESEREK